jgi:transposase
VIKLLKWSVFIVSKSEFVKWLKKNKVTAENSVIVMESTGVYSEKLCHFLYEKSHLTCVENALKVKRAFGISPRKNDIIDSKRIAEYAFRFFDKLKFWKPTEHLIEQVKSLLSIREYLRIEVSSHMASLKALKKKQVQSKFALDTHLSVINDFKKKIKAIEEEIKALVSNDLSLEHKLHCIKSIPGVGFLIAVNLMVITNAFKENLDYRTLASYIGIAPIEKTSGTSVNIKITKKFGHSRLKKLFYLCSMNMVRHKLIFSDYYNRKVVEGKKKLVVLNNISNKMLRIICGVIKSGKPFIPGYVSLSPQLILSKK